MSSRLKNALILALAVVVVAATIYVLTDKSADLPDTTAPASTASSAGQPLPAVTTARPAAGTSGAATQTTATPATAASTMTAASTAPGAAATKHLRQVERAHKPIVDFLGSSLTAGCCTTDFGHTWPYLLQLRLEAAVGPLTIDRHVFPGTTLPNILLKGGISSTIADKPDLVIFETSGTNDCGQNVTEAASDAALLTALDQLRHGLPKASIVVQTSSPKTDPKLCAGGISYPTFMAHQASVLRQQHDAMFFDLYTAMNAKIGKNLKPYLFDITHPNNAGAAVWADLIGAYLGV